MRILQRKTSHYTEPQKVQRMGLYPFFRVIESDQDTTVTIKGKKVLMFGSNSYMGLTNHPSRFRLIRFWHERIITSPEELQCKVLILHRSRPPVFNDLTRKT
jgi:7-keto-8-aminopelargonate synthetase-like enzyme